MLVSLAAALALASCKADAPPPKPTSEPAGVDDDEAAHETGEEGDDDAQLPSAAHAVAGPCGPALLGEVSRIVRAARRSSYSHKTIVDEASGTFELDCSGLVDYALARVCPDALHTVRSGKRPLAKHFVEAFSRIAPGEKKGSWRRVGKPSDLAPGDVVAWLKPADVTTNNTGHVMIVRAPVTSARGEVSVPIVDSTSVRHGAGDSRAPTKATGVGEGTVHIVVDEAGNAVAYRWSNGKKARPHATSIAMGRLD